MENLLILLAAAACKGPSVASTWSQSTDVWYKGEEWDTTLCCSLACLFIASGVLTKQRGYIE